VTFAARKAVKTVEVASEVPPDELFDGLGEMERHIEEANTLRLIVMPP